MISAYPRPVEKYGLDREAAKCARAETVRGEMV